MIQQNRMFWGWKFCSTGIILSLIDIDSISCVYIKQTRGQFSWTLQLLTTNWHHISDKKASHYVIFYCVLMRWWVWWQIYVHTCHFILRIYKKPFADLTASVQFLVPELKTEVTEQLSKEDGCQNQCEHPPPSDGNLTNYKILFLPRSKRPLYCTVITCGEARSCRSISQFFSFSSSSSNV